MALPRLLQQLLWVLALVSSPACAAGPDLPPLRFSQVEAFLGAIAIDAEIAVAVESFWKPAIDAIVAANPQKATEARTFAEARRAREIPIYRPLVAFHLDNAAPLIFDRRLRDGMEAVLETQQSLARNHVALDDPRRQALAARLAALRREAVKPTNKGLDRSVVLAGSPDGVALRGLNRAGLYYCLPDLQPDYMRDARNKAAADRRDAACAPLLRDPLLSRLEKTAGGHAFVVLSARAHLAMLGDMALGHAAGTGPRQLIRTEDYAAAGLVAP